MSDSFETSAPEPEPAPEKPVLRTAEVASMFGRTDRCIRNWVTAGHLHPVRIGRSTGGPNASFTCPAWPG